ncbi:MAG: PglZ domain-containing protein [Ignavibacteriales bacterium]|nr:MAG: PglZ domain-containing protein [Ignavibacteriales bacterium]
MIDIWITEELDKLLESRGRVVILDPSGQCNFLIPLLERKGYTLLKTGKENSEHWQQVREEFFLRFKAESAHKTDKVVFYAARPLNELSFLYDYCFTHGMINLSSPAEWIRKKLFALTGIQIQLESPLLITAAKESIGKESGWWKKILLGIEQIIDIQKELLPFLNGPEEYKNEKDPDVYLLFEVKLFELLEQPVRTIPPKTLAAEITQKIFSGLMSNTLSGVLLEVYYAWADSNTYYSRLEEYRAAHEISSITDFWEAHPDHCFEAIDRMQLKDIALHFRDKSYITEKLRKAAPRIRNRKSLRFIPSWWKDIQTLAEFNTEPLGACNSFGKVIDFYKTHFHKLDRAVRNLYAEFIQEEDILRPLQEHYESRLAELLEHWYDFSSSYKEDQSGHLPRLFRSSKGRIAVIVCDGLRYEIAESIAAGMESNCRIVKNIMIAGIPSITEHNMSALYSESGEEFMIHAEREKQLLAQSGKEIAFLDLEELHEGVTGDNLVLTYKDIDDAGEKLQQGVLKLFREFEKVITEKILLLLKMNFHEVHLVTDHGFVLTGLLTEADKLDPAAEGKKEVHERFLRTAEKQNRNDWIQFERPHDGYRYVYAAKNHRPFKSKGVYGFAHGGLTPQEIIIPNFVFSRSGSAAAGLKVSIINKKDLAAVTGEYFVVKLTADRGRADLFSSSRKVQLLLYAQNILQSTSALIAIEAGSSASAEFSFGGSSTINAVLTDAETKEHLDSVKVSKSNARDLDGLL